MKEFMDKHNIHNLKNPEYVKEKAQCIELYILRNLENRQICKTNFTLDYLLKCMDEYKIEGAYFYIDDIKDKRERLQNILLIEYLDIIKSFIQTFKQESNSILVSDFMDYMKSFLTDFTNSSVPIISSVHSMKGGEADNVFIYDYPKFPYELLYQTKEEIQQEQNLFYVAITRAKKTLNVLLIPTPPGASEKVKETIDELNDSCVAHIDSILNKKKKSR